jgi:hypothetical protein
MCRHVAHHYNVSNHNGNNYYIDPYNTNHNATNHFAAHYNSKQNAAN